MGKKRSRSESSGLKAEDAELEAELAAARDVLAEKKIVQNSSMEIGEHDEPTDIDQHAKPGQSKPRESVNNRMALQQALDDLNVQNGVRPWPETLDICHFPLELDDVHDDIKRETAFYNNTLAAVKEARNLLIQHKIPYRRPEDFFCDMLKSDLHMTKVKDRLLFQQKKIAAVESRRKQQQNRKFSKELKSHRAKKKNEERKQTLEAVKQWKNDKASRSGRGLLPDNDGLDEVLQGRQNTLRTKTGVTAKRAQPNRRRQAKDRTYGFGGPKRNFKRSDTNSLNDFSSFDSKKGKITRGSKKKGSGANRPGKMARIQNRMKRKKK